MRRALSLLLALCLLLTGLSACGEGDAPPSPTPEPTASPTPAPTPAPAPAAFALAYDPNASLHPITGTGQVNRDLAGLVYQGLYELDNTFSPQPVLAQSHRIGEDGLSWTFTIAPGVCFSDGTPLTAAHAAASLELARTSPLYAARLAGITSVSAGEGELTVTLSEPNGELPALLDVPVALDSGGAAPLGTGYYQYEQDGDGLALRVNPYYPSAHALPYNLIPLVPVTTSDERIAAFDSGAVSAVTTDFSGAYALGYSGNCEVTDYPTTDLLYVGFRCSGGPCAEPLVRRAFTRAFDRETVVSTLLAGHAEASALPASPRSVQYDRPCAELLSYSMEQAAALLAEAGWERDEETGLLARGRTALEVTLIVNSDSEAKQAAAALLAGALEELGASVTVSTLAWSAYTAALAAGEFDLYIGEVRLTADFDPSALLTGELNYGGFDAAAMEPLLAAWRGARGEERAAASSALWGQFAQEAPFAPLCFKNGSLLTRWGLASNLRPTRADPFYHMEEWTAAG